MTPSLHTPRLALLLAAAASLTLGACSSKMKNLQADYFSCRPNPLEVVGPNVPAAVTARIPAKFFCKDATLTITPILTFPSGSVEADPVTFQGENVRGNNPTVSYASGASLSIPASFVYQPEMAQSELSLRFNVRQGNKSYPLPQVKVADGIITTATLADAASVAPAQAPDKYQRIVNEKYRADIHFLVNQANVRPSESASEQMNAFKKELQNAAASDKRNIEEINISSYASPEGSYDYNYALAERREANTQAYLDSQLRRDNIADFGQLTSQFTPEDWDGFRELVAASNIQDKELILSVLSMYKDPAQREQEMRNMSSIFEQLAENILPQLRRSRLTASINVIGRSDTEIADAFASDPASLSVDELLYLANITPDPSRQRAIYEATTRLYPSDHRAFVNLGNIFFNQADYSNALAYYGQAEALNPQAGEARMNEALIDMVRHDLPAAQQKLGLAAGTDRLPEALGTFYLLSGDNARAASAFADTRSNNAALAQILNKDYSQAASILNSITPDATTYYLKAIIAARTNNDADAAANILKAANLDPSMAARARHDLEFRNINLSSILR